ncbi:class I SAM-dependent methyltransferase [Boseongicola aestuarii]|uniref:Methyltransferase domain protein n=1 Tax=Boseongicola aestuarii TaxID=1470561 RepID=A0A238J2S6_9RHOB|nr:class I SAM-dependent methyltransferase [Boseongicola aestuarii]SMX24260.1 Methyltransferase domain protein [Boseongicola aestuarii]
MKRGPLFAAAQRKFRSRRFLLIDEILRNLLSQKEKVSVLDAGGRPGYWKLLSPDLRSRVSIVCLNFTRELQLHAESVEDLRIEFEAGDACNMPQYGEGQFDLVHSNSVIEHVGNFHNMSRFASETARVGRGYYHQTPDLLFPIEPHYGVPFVHWLPESLRVKLFTKMNLGYAKQCDFGHAIKRADHTRIISKWMMRQFFPDAEVLSERVLFIPKSTVCYRIPQASTTSKNGLR